MAEDDFITLTQIVENHPWCADTGRIVDTTHPCLVRAIGDDFTLKLDFQIRGIGFCGAYVLPADMILDNSEKRNGFYIPQEPYYALALFTHSFLYHGAFRKYKQELADLAHDEEVQTVFRAFYGDEMGEQFLEWARQQEYDRILARRTRYMLWFLLRRPTQTVDIVTSLIYRAGNKYGVWNLLHTLNPFRMAPLVALMGVDKSGKSTLADYTKEELERQGQDAVIVNGGVFQQYPPFTWINRARRWLQSRQSSTDTEPEETYDEKVQSPETGSASTAAMLYRIANSAVTHCRIFLHRQRGRWVVTDRYTWDIVFFLGASSFWERLVRRLFPDPDLAFHITVSNDTLQERDCELAPDSISRIKDRIAERKEDYGLINVENEDLDDAKETIREYMYQLLTGN